MNTICNLISANNVWLIAKYVIIQQLVINVIIPLCLTVIFKLVLNVKLELFMIMKQGFKFKKNISIFRLCLACSNGCN